MIKRVSLKEQVYESMVKEIIKYNYKPNEIITENLLMEKYNVSKAPIREALIELCKDNYLKSLPRLGYQVVSCSLKEIIDILDFRSDLEISNLKRLFPSLDQKKIDSLEPYLETSQFFVIDNSDIAAHWFNNQKFHLQLCRLSSNDYTYSVLQNLLKQNSRFFAQYYSNNKNESKGKYHKKIYEAIKNKDLKTACEALVDDINSVKSKIQSELSI